MSSNEASTSLDAQQLQAVHSEAATLRVLAGAGSGKTRVLTQRVMRRIADETADPQHTLVLTFTRKAADELSGRMRASRQTSVATGTFHAIAYAQLRKRWADQGRTAPTVMAQPTRMLSKVLESLRLNRLANVRLIVTELSWAKSHMLRPADYIQGLATYNHRPPVSSTQMLRVYDAYEVEKKKRRTVDYDDLLLLLTDALRMDRSFAAAQQWQFRHFFVDEFQDLNRAQFELLRAWIGPRDDLFVVGDPNQAIYGWNGADASYLNMLDRYYPNLKTVSLSTNYRSSQNVLAAAHSLLDDAATAPEDALQGEVAVLREFDDDIAEAEGIARAARDARHRDHGWSEIAVLVRTNAQRGPLESAFTKFKIPFRSTGGASWLYEADVAEALRTLRNLPNAPVAQRVPDIYELIDEANERDGGYLHQLLDAIQTCLATDPSTTATDFLSWVEVGSQQDGPVGSKTRSAVTITTFHRAKGLEWPVVFLAGLENGLVPISNADNEEERRLFYVAITRAREELHFSWAKRRTAGVVTREREVSPWLAKVMASNRPPKPGAVETVHQAIDESRTSLHVAPHDAPQRNALLKWRASRAKLTGVEAKLILDDHVIDAIIDIRPASRDELADIEGLGPVRAANIGDELLELLT